MVLYNVQSILSANFGWIDKPDVDRSVKAIHVLPSGMGVVPSEY